MRSVLGILSAAPVQRAVERMILGDRHAQFERWGLATRGFDSWRVIRWMTWLAMPVVACVFAWAVLGVTGVTESSIRVGDPLALSHREYPFTRIRSIVYRPDTDAPKGDRQPRPHFVVTFDDARQWTTLDVSATGA